MIAGPLRPFQPIGDKFLISPRPDAVFDLDELAADLDDAAGDPTGVIDYGRSGSPVPIWLR